MLILDVNPERRLILSHSKLFNLIVSGKVGDTKRESGAIGRYRTGRVAESGKKVVERREALANKSDRITDNRGALNSRSRLGVICNFDENPDIWIVRRAQYIGNRETVLTLGKIGRYGYIEGYAIRGGSSDRSTTIKINLVQSFTETRTVKRDEIARTRFKSRSNSTYHFKFSISKNPTKPR